MKKENVERFLKTLYQFSIENGMECPILITDLGAEIGLNEDESNLIAEYLYKQKIIEYRGVGNELIQLK